MRDWIEVEEAWSRIEQLVKPLPSETIELADAPSRVLAESIRCDRDYPPFDRAAMDGFAVRSEDVMGAAPDAPVELDVVGEATPGCAFEASAPPSGAVRIMTGAPVPAGWDSVVPVESTSGFETPRVRVFAATRAGQHVAPRGIERRDGETLFEVGHQVRDVDVGALAMAGASRLRVAARPRIAVLSTGDELVAFEKQPGPTQIRNSNAPMLAALAERDGPVEFLGAVEDSRARTYAAVKRGLEHDLLLVTGGVSMGAYDWVGAALQDAGVTLHFRRVALQPGKPVVFGTHARGAVLALPGNPVSAYTTFRLFAQPLLRCLQGASDVRPHWGRATARFEWQRRAPKCILLPGRILPNGGAVERVRYTGSGDLMAYARANCQIVLPTHGGDVRSGDPVHVWPLEPTFHRAPARPD